MFYKNTFTFFFCMIFLFLLSFVCLFHYYFCYLKPAVNNLL
ncbi:hypothetical protein PROPEN_02695 [Proteus penneri ATCC 35198]|nr:hypothetical protein PROPEN_02695 [Proteus penneri ATCC 35198]